MCGLASSGRKKMFPFAFARGGSNLGLRFDDRVNVTFTVNGCPWFQEMITYAFQKKTVHIIWLAECCNLLVGNVSANLLTVA